MPQVVGIVRRVLFVSAVLGVARCGSTTSPTRPTQPSVPVLTTVTITGNAAFTASGQTGQFTATGGYSDGTTKDLTKNMKWTSQIESVAVISADGVLDTVGLGATAVTAVNSLVAPGDRNYARSVLVTVTPPGTFAVSGWTREPGSGPLGGVRVAEPFSGQSAFSQATGEWALGGLTSGALTFTKGGYEATQFTATPGEFGETPLQQVVQINDGSSISQRLAPHDVGYVVGTDSCQPCRMIRVTSSAPGTLQLRATWTDAAAVLNIWVNGQMFAGSAASHEVAADAIVGVGEFVVYVGKLKSDVVGGYVPFTFATSR